MKFYKTEFEDKAETDDHCHQHQQWEHLRLSINLFDRPRLVPGPLF